jgi:hypothetical protein
MADVANFAKVRCTVSGGKVVYPVAGDLGGKR